MRGRKWSFSINGLYFTGHFADKIALQGVYFLL